MAAWAGGRESVELLLLALRLLIALIVDRLAEVDGVRSDLRVILIGVPLGEGLLFCLILNRLHLREQSVLLSLGGRNSL